MTKGPRYRAFAVEIVPFRLERWPSTRQRLVLGCVRALALVSIIATLPRAEAAESVPPLSCEAFVSSLPDGATHECQAGCWESRCAEFCDKNADDEVCNQLCQNYGGLGYCPGRCQNNPDLSCLPDYADKDAVCPAFGGPMWRFGARAEAGLVFGALSGPMVGGVITLGRRVTSEWSFVTKVPLALAGYDTRGSYLLGAGVELGGERLFVDALFDSSALALGVSAGVWAPNLVHERPFLLAPVVSTDLTLLLFDWSDEPRYGPFRSNLSLGLEAAGGYEPTVMQGVFRTGLTLGLDIAAY